MIKKIVVYILLFSFLLLDLPQGVFANTADAMNPTPPPGGVHWEFNIENVSSGQPNQVLQFYYDAGNSRNHLDFHIAYSGVGLEESTTSDSTGLYVPIGGKTQWSTWIGGSAGKKLYILTDSDSYVRNVCDSTAINASGVNPMPYFFHLVTSPTTVVSDPSIGCFFHLNDSGAPDRTDNDRTKRVTGLTDPLPSPNSTEKTYNDVFNKILSRYSNNRIAAYQRPAAPIAANVTACKKYTAKNMVTDDGQLWLNSVIDYTKASEKIANGTSASPVSDAFFNDQNAKNKIKADAKKYNTDAISTFWGDINSPYPTKIITFTENQRLINDNDKLLAARPVPFTGSSDTFLGYDVNAWSNALLAAGALLAAPGATVVAAYGGGAVVMAAGAGDAVLGYTALTAGAGAALGSIFGAWKINGSNYGPVITYLNNREKADSVPNIAEWFSKYGLDLYYAWQNYQFTKCLADKGDPYAVVNQALYTTLTKLAPASLADAGTALAGAGTNDPVTHCPPLLGVGSFLFGPLNAMMCNVMWFIWTGVKKFVEWTAGIAARSVGYDDSSP